MFPSACVYRWMLVAGMAALVCARATGQSTAVVFEDVTVAAGVDYLHWDGTLTGGLGSLETVARMSAGVAPGDYDADGYTDLYVTRVAAANLLFRNLGNGTFVEVGAAAGVSLVAESSACGWADVDNDGKLDLLVLTFHPDDRQYLYLNNGDGTFTEDAVARGLRMPHTGEGTRRFTGLAFGDYDLDGWLDLFVTEWSGFQAKNHLYRNTGAGYFANMSGTIGPALGAVFGFSPAFADFDDDGDPDIAIAADFATSRLLENLGTGQFADITAPAGVGTDENGMGSAIGDYDGDGDLDWFVTSIFDPNDTCATYGCSWGATGNRLYRNEGAMQFVDATDAAGVRDGAWGWGASWFDANNDGELDLAMTNGIRYPTYSFEDPFNYDLTRFWLNSGGALMVDSAQVSGFVDDRSGKGFAVFDYDGDGDLDVFIANTEDHPVLFRNQGGSANDWLGVRLRGHKTNRYGIGARVSIETTPGGPTQVREISLNANYMSHNEPVAHFGVGPGAGNVHSLTVFWPVSGYTQVLNNLPAKQTVVIEEPCAGDANDDDLVNISDLGALLSNYGATGGATRADGDLDWDGAVNITDLGILLADFGANCL